MGLCRSVTKKVNTIYYVYQFQLGHGTLQDLLNDSTEPFANNKVKCSEKYPLLLTSMDWKANCVAYAYSVL